MAKKLIQFSLIVEAEVDLDDWTRDYGLETTAEADADATNYLPQAFEDHLRELNRDRTLAYKVERVTSKLNGSWNA